MTIEQLIAGDVPPKKKEKKYKDTAKKKKNYTYTKILKTDHSMSTYKG